MRRCNLGSTDCCVLQEVWKGQCGGGEDGDLPPSRTYVHRTSAGAEDAYDERCFSFDGSQHFFAGNIDGFSGKFSISHNCNDDCSNCDSQDQHIETINGECLKWNDVYPGDTRSEDVSLRFTAVSCSAFTCKIGTPNCCLVEEDYVGNTCEGPVGFRHFFTYEDLNKKCGIVAYPGGSAFFWTRTDLEKGIVKIGLNCDAECNCRTPVEVIGEGICYRWASLNPQAIDFPHKSARWTPFPCSGGDGVLRVSTEAPSSSDVPSGSDASSSSGAGMIVILVFALAGFVLAVFAFFRRRKDHVVAFENVPTQEMSVR